MHLRGDDHHVEQRLERLGDEGLEDVGGDRQRHAAMSAISVLQPAVQLRTTPVLMSPRVVRTPLTRPLARSMPGDLGVGVDLRARRASAPRAKPHTTASWRMIPPGGW